MTQDGSARREKWNAYMRAYQKSDRVRFRRQFQKYSERERRNEDMWQRDKVLCGIDCQNVYDARSPFFWMSYSETSRLYGGFKYEQKWNRSGI